ncbi:hypothetical protein [Streptomyces sp. NBC_00211]|uniref:hypothetical protein n=1 Tax=Streptomyces sp. NBC_00211 TaxID=2975683 RepID=UPI003253BCF7
MAPFDVPFHNVGETTYLDSDAALEVMALLTVAASVGGGAVLCTNFADETSRVRVEDFGGVERLGVKLDELPAAHGCEDG